MKLVLDLIGERKSRKINPAAGVTALESFYETINCEFDHNLQMSFCHVKHFRNKERERQPEGEMFCFSGSDGLGDFLRDHQPLAHKAFLFQILFWWKPCDRCFEFEAKFVYLGMKSGP